MTVHVIFGGCSFTQIYNSYANLIALANTPADNDERRNYPNQRFSIKQFNGSCFWINLAIINIGKNG